MPRPSTSTGIFRNVRSWTGRRIHVEPFILTREIVEKVLLDELRLHYRIAIPAEQAAVKAAGVSWSGYQCFNKQYEKSIDSEHLKRVPRNLDLRPYEDEKDLDVLRRIMAGARLRLRPLVTMPAKG